MDFPLTEDQFYNQNLCRMRSRDRTHLAQPHVHQRVPCLAYLPHVQVTGARRHQSRCHPTGVRSVQSAWVGRVKTSKLLGAGAEDRKHWVASSCRRILSTRPSSHCSLPGLRPHSLHTAQLLNYRHTLPPMAPTATHLTKLKTYSPPLLMLTVCRGSTEVWFSPVCKCLAKKLSGTGVSFS